MGSEVLDSVDSFPITNRSSQMVKNVIFQGQHFPPYWRIFRSFVVVKFENLRYFWVKMDPH